MLFVQTATRDAGRSASDLTARARIRDAAVDCFAESGFDAPYRAIAQRAGVSPGLITHHFGTKAALRAECDADVLRRYHVLKSAAVENPSGSIVETLAVPGTPATVLVYMLRAIHAGGQAARDFMESLVDHSRVIMAASVASGLVRASRDEEARLRYMANQAMGAMLVQFLLADDPTPDEFVASLSSTTQDSILPMLELYTEGMLTSTEMLDDYLRYLWEPPDRGPASEPVPSTA